MYQHFSGSTGYGHEEAGGREALDHAFAEIFGAEASIVRAQVCHFSFVVSLFDDCNCSTSRWQFFSGTHAITCALFAFLRPGDEVTLCSLFTVHVPD